MEKKQTLVIRVIFPLVWTVEVTGEGERMRWRPEESQENQPKQNLGHFF